MTSESSQKRYVAVVGGGVSGLSAAWHLHVNCSDVEVYLFEADDRLGGHAHTVSVATSNSKATVDVDVGFMVYNEDNYPNMCQWFDEMGIVSEPTDMSLSVSLDDGKTVEWSSLGLAGLAANKLQLCKPSFYRFLRDMIRFNKEAGKILRLKANDPRRQITTGQYLQQEGYSDAFATYYLIPMMAALWSASIDEVLSFPAAQLVGFLCNHKMLQIFDRPQWKTVSGRSHKYTGRMLEILGNQVKLSCNVSLVKQIQNGGSQKYEIFASQRSKNDTSLGTFDDVIFACHAPKAEELLREESHCDEELLRLLGQIQYEENMIYLHSDPKLMPRNKSSWSSWNCLGKSDLIQSSLSRKLTSGEAFEGGESGFGNTVSESATFGRMKAVYVTYWLNKLQNITGEDIFVSLNPHIKPSPSFVHKKLSMSHPQFTPQTLLARDTLASSFQGKNGLWFCGAWQGYGFHEDGCRAGFSVATSLSNVSLPWCVEKKSMILPPPQFIAPSSPEYSVGVADTIFRFFCYTLPVFVCKKMVLAFLQSSIKKGNLVIQMVDGKLYHFGDKSPCGCDESPVTLEIFDDWFFVKIALEYDLGLARSYMAGFFTVKPLKDPTSYDAVIRPPTLRDESNVVLGDPVGLTRLFHLFIGNRDCAEDFKPSRAVNNHKLSHAFSNAGGLLLARAGSMLSFFKYKFTMDNSERGGSLKNIHAHYDLSNDLFRSFLDKETLMYSSGIYDGVKIPCPYNQCKLKFRGTLEEAEMRKLDTLLARAQIKPGQTMVDIGFGWGGLSIWAAKKYGVTVTGITLSVEQKALAEKRIKAEGVEDLITFEVVDYRTFSRRNENKQKFDRVLSCEMIEAVGHNHLGEFFCAVEQILHPDGILVLEAITTPESRYENYLRTTDFINTIIFPGSCCPSLHALIDASYKWSTLTLEHVDNIGLHYAETLREWRRRFNANEKLVRKLGFDDIFLRVWNYYLAYCEAGFDTQTENCLILVFSRPGCRSLLPLCETRSCTQMKELDPDEIKKWLSE